MSRDPNINTVELAATALGALLDDLVLVGGCAVGLLVTDQARALVRHTIDVDLLTEVTSTKDYYELSERLRSLGFSEQPTDEVICRWAYKALLIDVMPTDSKVLGFANRWYPEAARYASLIELPSGRSMRLITAPHFLATKFEAFAARGAGDYLHHDMEDIVTVIDGRESIVAEVLACHANVRNFLVDEIDALLADSQFVDRITWLLPPDNLAARFEVVMDRMRRIAGL